LDVCRRYIGRKRVCRSENGVEECDVGFSPIIRNVRERGREQVFGEGVPSVAIIPSIRIFRRVCNPRKAKRTLHVDGNLEGEGVCWGVITVQRWTKANGESEVNTVVDSKKMSSADGVHLIEVSESKAPRRMVRKKSQEGTSGVRKIQEKTASQMIVRRVCFDGHGENDVASVRDDRRLRA
jgi:hypothetical protein